ncbi:guided entry of tail-anchored proteins factor 1 [Syngnathus typhle]
MTKFVWEEDKSAFNMAASCAWILVLASVFLCNLMKILLPNISSFLSRMVQKDAEQENYMRVEIQAMKKEQSSISMMDEFARHARLERKINKMTDKLKTHVQSRTAQQAKMKWVVNIVFYLLQAALMISLIWQYYSDPVTVLPSKWIAPVERLVAFPTGVAGGVGITCWLVVCNKVVTLGMHAFS